MTHLADSLSCGDIVHFSPLLFSLLISASFLHAHFFTVQTISLSWCNSDYIIPMHSTPFWLPSALRVISSLFGMVLLSFPVSVPTPQPTSPYTLKLQPQLPSHVSHSVSFCRSWVRCYLLQEILLKFPSLGWAPLLSVPIALHPSLLLLLLGRCLVHLFHQKTMSSVGAGTLHFIFLESSPMIGSYLLVGDQNKYWLKISNSLFLLTISIWA